MLNDNENNFLLSDNTIISSYTQLEDNLYLCDKDELYLESLDGTEHMIIPACQELYITKDNSDIIVGGARVEYKNGSIVELEDFTIFDNYRNKGYGSRILKYAIAHGLEYINCLSNNTDALRFYKRHGFEIEDEILIENTTETISLYRLHLKSEVTMNGN